MSESLKILKMNHSKIVSIIMLQNRKWWRKKTNKKWFFLYIENWCL